MMPGHGNLVLESRVPSGPYGAAIGEAFRRLPSGIRNRLSHVQFICGVSPIFAGLHRYEAIGDGRSYATTAHCCWPWNIQGPADRRVTTVVLPTVDTAQPHVIVHELGHALHDIVGLHAVAQPVTWYAKTNRYEAFAEALVAHTHYYGDRDVYHGDKKTIALFRELS